METEEVGVTSTELLMELLKAKRDTSRPSGALRTNEIKRLLGWSTDNIRKFLKSLKDDGLIEVIKVRVVTLDDKAQPLPHYRIKDDPEVEALVESMIGRRDGN